MDDEFLCANWIDASGSQPDTEISENKVSYISESFCVCNSKTEYNVEKEGYNNTVVTGIIKSFENEFCFIDELMVIIIKI